MTWTAEEQTICLLWSLEQRGVSVRINDDGELVIKPMSLIPASDRILIRRHKPRILYMIREVLGQIPSRRLVPSMGPRRGQS
jgi:hypothetical protein